MTDHIKDDERMKRIADSFRPYDTVPEFWVGVKDYFEQLDIPFDRYDGYRAQAYDRGRNAAMRYKRGDDR